LQLEKGEEEMDLKGKVALITGGGSGIGAGIARRFVKDGAKVCICGRREEMLNKVAGSLPKGSVVTCPGDVTRPADAERMVKTTLDFAGKLDVLVNDAGIDTPGDILEIDLEVWNRVIATNLTGPMLMIRNAIPFMLKAGGGSIINIASLAGVRCIPGMPAYCASKAGLIMLTQQVALDYSPLKIRSNVVCPGAVKSMLENPPAPISDEMIAQIDQTMTKMAKYSPLRRAGTTAEIAGICAFLASDDSAFMTGAVLMADGGSAIVDVNAADMIASGQKWTH
jgi:meso-butanediol dehydrogenase / (S,S)-butanediol dehydrogenase / diacetyl reductase